MPLPDAPLPDAPLPDALPVSSVLVIDDEPEALAQARRVLEGDGFAVTSAESGAAGLKVIEHERLQLVLTEVSLRDVDGIDILMAVRANHPDTPVIVISARSELDEARTAVRQGAFQYIQKPLAADDLLTICRRAVETLRLKVENRMLKQAANLPAVARRPRASSRPERAAMERAALTRVTQFMDEAIAKTSTRVLEQALGELTPGAGLADVLADLLLEGGAEGEWAAALLRGAQAQRELLREAGGALSASEVGTLLGIGRAAVDKRRRHGTLLGLRVPSGDFVYPGAQFVKNDVLAGFTDVLGAFRIKDPWMQLDALLSRHESLDGRTAFEALAEGDVDVVRRVVSNSGEQGL